MVVQHIATHAHTHMFTTVSYVDKLYNYTNTSFKTF